MNGNSKLTLEQKIMSSCVFFCFVLCEAEKPNYQCVESETAGHSFISHYLGFEVELGKFECS